ncbi:hypothetical protein F4801DRAFT_588231 [Xylaria longipes]|nr:hypothetical protein F4801DRAFT_588231 [Xylaria longipes]
MPPPKQRPTYFVPANFDFPPPPDGPVTLGQLITHPENPGRVVDPAGPLPFEGETEIGLFGRALQAVSFKIGLSFSRAAVSYVLNDIDRLDVEFIEPTDDYVKASMERPKVKAALKNHLLRKRLYMVTGIKTAYPGAKLDRKDVSKTAIVGEGEFSGPAEVGDVGVGSHASLSASELQALTLVPMKPFVYGYRLQECYYTFRSLHNREHVDGALFGVGSGDTELTEDSSIPDDREDDIEIEFNGIDEDDLCDWELEDGGGQFEVVTAVDEYDGASCDVILPVTD